MVEAPTEEEFWNEVLESEDLEYHKRIDESTAYNGMGDLGMGIYLTAKEIDFRDKAHSLDLTLENPPKKYYSDFKNSYNIAGGVAASIRIVDDILDGHNCEALDKDDRSEFKKNYIRSVRSGKIGDNPDHQLAQAAYRSGRILNRLIDDNSVKENVVMRMEEMGDAVVEENKSTVEDYLEATEADSAGYTKLIVDVMKILPSFNPGEDFYLAAHDLGMAYGISDDILDKDIELPEEDLRRLHEKTFRDLSENRGTLFQAASKLGKHPKLYDLMLDIGKIQKKISS